MPNFKCPLGHNAKLFKTHDNKGIEICLPIRSDKEIDVIDLTTGEKITMERHLDFRIYKCDICCLPYWDYQLTKEEKYVTH